MVLRDLTEVGPEAIDALAQVGCDDATISVRFGQVFLAFRRAAKSLEHAVQTVTGQLRKAKLGAKIGCLKDRAQALLRVDLAA